MNIETLIFIIQTASVDQMQTFGMLKVRNLFYQSVSYTWYKNKNNPTNCECEEIRIKLLGPFSKVSQIKYCLELVFECYQNSFSSFFSVYKICWIDNKKKLWGKTNSNSSFS